MKLPSAGILQDDAPIFLLLNDEQWQPMPSGFERYIEPVTAELFQTQKLETLSGPDHLLEAILQTSQLLRDSAWVNSILYQRQPFNVLQLIRLVIYDISNHTSNIFGIY